MDIRVQAVPGASRDLIETLDDGVLKIWVTAPPVKGAANKAIIELLAKHLGVKKYDVELVSGFSSRNKIFRVDL